MYVSEVRASSGHGGTELGQERGGRTAAARGDRSEEEKWWHQRDWSAVARRRKQWGQNLMAAATRHQRGAMSEEGGLDACFGGAGGGGCGDREACAHVRLHHVACMTIATVVRLEAAEGVEGLMEELEAWLPEQITLVVAASWM